MRLRAASRALLALAALGLHAGDGPGAPGKPALAYLGTGLAEGGSAPEWLQAFQATLTEDLKLAGAFRFMEGAAGRQGPNGPELLLSTRVRPEVRRRVIVACRCLRAEDQGLLFSRAFVGTRQTLPRLAHRIADFVVGRVTGTEGIADSVIVFSRRTASGVSELFRVDPEGKQLQKLTTFGSIATHPALAPDGRLALVTFKGGPPQIWGQTRPMGPMTKLFPLGGPEGMGLSDLAWSPDGTRIAFILEHAKGTAALHILEVEAGREAVVTSAAFRASSPSWNPAGTALAFISDQTGVPQVTLVGADGRGCRQVTQDPSPKHGAAWNPAGDRIAYGAQGRAGSTLMTIGPDGRDARQVATQSGTVASLHWSPDGRWLLLGLQHGSVFQFAVTGLDGTSRNLADGLQGTPWPQWTRRSPFLPSLFQAGPSAPHMDPAPTRAASHL